MQGQCKAGRRSGSRAAAKETWEYIEDYGTDRVDVPCVQHNVGAKFSQGHAQSNVKEY